MGYEYPQRFVSNMSFMIFILRENLFVVLPRQYIETDCMLCLILRLALDALKKWNQLQKFHISQQADGLCRAVFARSVLEPAFK